MRHEFQQTYLYWLVGAVPLVVAVMSPARQRPRRSDNRSVLGPYGLVFLLGDWTYQLVGDKRTVNIAVGGVVVILAPIAGFGGVRLGSYRVARKSKPPARNASATNPFLSGAGDSGRHRHWRTVG